MSQQLFVIDVCYPHQVDLLGNGGLLNPDLELGKIVQGEFIAVESEVDVGLGAVDAHGTGAEQHHALDARVGSEDVDQGLAVLVLEPVVHVLACFWRVLARDWSAGQ